MYKVKFTLGDVYDNETYHMKSNYPGTKINEVLMKFEGETGCKIKSWCEDWGDTRIHYRDTKKLLDLGIISMDEISDEEFDCDDTTGYIDLISRIIKYYLPDFEWDPESFDEEETLYINNCGYGLLYM